MIPTELQGDFREAAVDVDDNAVEEPLIDWDRDNPIMIVGTIYRCMSDFRMTVRQHAIVNEFELGTEKSDKSRFRGYCKSTGCPWIIRARTTADNSVRVHILIIIPLILFIQSYFALIEFFKSFSRCR